MRKLVLAALLGASLAPALAAPAFAQSYQDQQRWEAAQARYQRETDIYQQERDRYYARSHRGGPDYGYAPPPPGGYGYAPPSGSYTTDYDAARYYRQGSYQDRQLAYNEQVYRGSDGRYYCKRSDGTTGLVVGAATGGLLGNVIDGGHNRVAGTLIGGALGALVGKSVEQSNDQYHCR